jgi:uncharacterized protein
MYSIPIFIIILAFVFKKHSKTNLKLDTIFILQFMRTLIALLLLPFFFVSCQKTKKEEQFAHTNDLINETSPYLLQHAHNPVNWMPWKQETLEKAKSENKLLIISVGYSACHWCHVMEKESFENDSVAKLMNDNFISIKVDREERPDIDQVYINAVQLMTGKSGWPLNCIALPDGRPIFGGTYFTKEEWIKALKQISELYKNDPKKAIEYANKLMAGLQNQELIDVNTKEAKFEHSEVETAVRFWKKEYLDTKNGGQVGEQKFPMPNSLNFLLRYSIQNKDENLQKYVETSLTKMAYGGIYDHVGGGFSRYSVDEKWHIPHFEKMLYDNAQLVSLYSDAYLVTKNDRYKQTVIETLAFVERELMNANGAFYSSIDADSKNDKDKLEEGAFYVWKQEELKSLLKSDFNLFKEYYNINDFGLWEKENYVLIKTTSDDNFTQNHKILTYFDLNDKVKNWKKILLKAREKRKRPHLDDKTLTSWNALMISGYTKAYSVFKNPHYLEVALKNANFILSNQLNKDGSLYHSYKEGKSTINGFSDDYATVIEAFINLYQVTLDEKWLNTAKGLMDYTITHFQDKKSNLFFFTSNKDKNLIARKMEIIDNVIPGSNSILANNLFKLGHYYSNANYSKIAQQMLNNIKEEMKISPVEYSNWMHLMLNYTDNYYEVAVSGKDAKQKIQQIQNYYLPNILMAGATQESTIPLMESRFMVDQTYIYVCVNSACKLPETDVTKAIEKLK